MTITVLSAADCVISASEGMNKLQLWLLGLFSYSEFIIRLMKYKSSLEKKMTDFSKN